MIQVYKIPTGSSVNSVIVSVAALEEFLVVSLLVDLRIPLWIQLLAFKGSYG
jgi:hypothetical protein